MACFARDLWYPFVAFVRFCELFPLPPLALPALCCKPRRFPSLVFLFHSSAWLRILILLLIVILICSRFPSHPHFAFPAGVLVEKEKRKERSAIANQPRRGGKIGPTPHFALSSKAARLSGSSRNPSWITKRSLRAESIIGTSSSNGCALARLFGASFAGSLGEATSILISASL